MDPTPFPTCFRFLDSLQKLKTKSIQEVSKQMNK